MTTDSDIKRDVEAELRWDPDIDATDIGVAVKDGVVTLTGFVRSYSQKYQAEREVKKVKGVRGVANAPIPRSSATPSPRSSASCPTPASISRRSPGTAG
jgi:hypothetical protein